VKPAEQEVRRVYRDIPQDLRRLIEPVVEDSGCELVDVEMAVGAARSGSMRITIDRVEGDGRVPVELCAKISREIGTQLDANDVVSGSYNLEVSSPGLDRLLAREKDFAAARGKEVKLKTRRPVGGRRRFKGRLLDFSDGTVLLKVDGQDFEIPFVEIERANSMYQFSRADFSSEKSSSAAR
jgi:ribosome maturation factor RimP